MSSFLLPDENSCLLEYRQFCSLVTKLRQAWEEFQATGRVAHPETIKPEVLASWERCKNMKLDPYASPNRVCLSPSELEERLEKNRLLIEVATPFLETLAESVKTSGFRIDLLDKELFILRQYGEDKAIREAAEHGSKPGVNRSESTSGTNAINLAAYLQRPVQLVGPEHYNVNLHYWTCSAVPILSPTKELLGVINIAGHFSLLHKHTLGMVIAIGKVIEQTIQQRQLMEALEISNQYLNNVIHAVSDGLIVVNANNIITTLNRAASNLLGVDAVSALGEPVDNVLGPANPFTEVLRSGKPIVNREIMLKTKKGHTQFFIGTLEPVTTKQGLEGVIGVLKPLSSAKGFVKNVAGLKAYFSFADLIGNSPEFQRAVQLAKQAAELPTTVLLQGESGTGKELFAQAIHNASPFKNGPFVALNCAAIPGELVESELFGYESGAFTGAKKEGRPGKFELAEGGTIFLDEISSMSLNVQAKLLRVLQTKTIMRVGGVTEIPVNVRLICATNRDLWTQVEEGSFREDLFYRINVLTIVIPPLRERIEDIPLLVEHFCSKLSQRLGVSFQVDPKVYEVLTNYQWPGNVRELENLVERSAILALTRGSQRIEVSDVITYPGLRDSHKQSQQENKEMSISGYSLKEMESTAIRGALKICKGNVSQAARLLGVHRSTLYRKLKLYGVNREIVVK